MKAALITSVAIALFTSLFIISSSNKTPADTEKSHNHGTTFMAAIQDTTKDDYPVKRTEAEWKEILTPEEFRILRKKGTELPYVNEYNDNTREGIYVCAACGQKLYSSEHKYKSGSGWPSFWQPLEPNYVEEKVDNSWFMTRTEIVCSNCGSHLGHVFDDGPEPTGLRYCMNSAAMDFIAKGETEKEN